jgi:integrase
MVPTQCPQQQQISEKVVAALPVPKHGNKVFFFSGATLQGKKAPAGFGVRVTAGGTKAFVLFHRVDGKKYLETLGRWDENPRGGTLSVRDAIVKAEKLVKDIGKGRREDPRPERTRRQQDGGKPDDENIAGVLDLFVERYVKREASLRSAGMIEAQINRLVKPRIGEIGIYEIRRSHVVGMLDEIADEHGPRMADLALAYARKAFNWYASRDDSFQVPIVKGMGRTKPKERARKRVLADDEIRDLWTALEQVRGVPAFVPRYVRLLFLTATRRNEAAMLRTNELDGSIWTIPAERYKNKLPHVIPLTTEVRAQIGKIEKGTGFIFSTDGGDTAINGFSKVKNAIDAAIAEVRLAAGREPMEDWTFHDLRRTARSLMSRAGVPADHAERCLGHVISGVRGVYDRHEFLEEKRLAFEALATIVGSILKGDKP